MSAPRDYAAWIAYLDGRQAQPFAWGSSANDCISFAAGAVRALTGRDLIAEAGLSWTTARGAARVLHRVGGISGALDRVLSRMPCARAHRGDVGLAVIEGRESVVVIEGELLAGPGLAGLVRVQRRGVLVQAWSVG